MNHEIAQMGTMRTGPDLSNIGVRNPSETWHYLHLYNPQITSEGSNMPPFRFLFETKKKDPRKPCRERLEFLGRLRPRPRIRSDAERGNGRARRVSAITQALLLRDPGGRSGPNRIPSQITAMKPGNEPGEDFDIRKVHGALLRETAEPMEAFRAAPWWLKHCIYAPFCIWGLWYLMVYSGGFNWDEYNEGVAGTYVPAQESGEENGQQTTATESTQSSDPAALIAEGKTVYSKVCVACHQANGQGLPGAFPPARRLRLGRRPGRTTHSPRPSRPQR